MRPLDSVLHDYLEALTRVGSPVSKVVVGLPSDFDWSAVKWPAKVTPFDDLKIYFTHINGYSSSALEVAGSSQPTFAWGMHALSIDGAIEEDGVADFARSDENPDYWPAGFLPVLADAGGSCIVVNCIQDSPTYGAVYMMDDGVGCNRVAGSLGKFFEGCTQEISHGLLEYWQGDLQVIREKQEQWSMLQPRLYGNSPYFSRTNKGEQVVDWKSRGRVLDTLSRFTAKLREKQSPKSEVADNLIAPIKTSPSASPEQSAIRSWALSVGWIEPHATESLHIQLSTAPVEHWYFDKSKLKPDTVTIRATVQHDRWLVQLERQDRLYAVQWRPDHSLSVDSAQMKYQRLTKWPELDGIENFPTLVEAVSKLLGIRFLPYADIGPHTRETEAMRSDPRLIAWLSPCADKVGCYIGGK